MVLIVLVNHGRVLKLQSHVCCLICLYEGLRNRWLVGSMNSSTNGKQKKCFTRIVLYIKHMQHVCYWCEILHWLNPHLIRTAPCYYFYQECQEEINVQVLPKLNAIRLCGVKLCSPSEAMDVEPPTDDIKSDVSTSVLSLHEKIENIQTIIQLQRLR